MSPLHQLPPTRSKPTLMSTWGGTMTKTQNLTSTRPHCRSCCWDQYSCFKYYFTLNFTLSVLSGTIDLRSTISAEEPNDLTQNVFWSLTQSECTILLGVYIPVRCCCQMTLRTGKSALAWATLTSCGQFDNVHLQNTLFFCEFKNSQLLLEVLRFVDIYKGLYNVNIKVNYLWWPSWTELIPKMN